jgi:hypothetical protein
MLYTVYGPLPYVCALIAGPLALNIAACIQKEGLLLLLLCILTFVTLLK